MSQSFPQWIQSYIDPKQLDSIELCVQEVEKQTSAELVAMVVRRSSTIGHVPFLLFLMGILISIILVYFELPYLAFDIWGVPEPVFYLVNLTLLLVLVRILAPLDFIERWLTPRSDQEDQVNQRAELEFYQSDIHKTVQRTGIFLFVSLMEKRAVVLADKAIAEKNPENTWPQVIDHLCNGVRNKDLAEGLTLALKRCGEVLAKDFPIQEGDQNELPNHLIIKD